MNNINNLDEIGGIVVLMMFITTVFFMIISKAAYLFERELQGWLIMLSFGVIYLIVMVFILKWIEDPK